MLQITPILAFSDNYIWCIYDPSSRQAIVIDPGAAQPVFEFLHQQQLQLIAIFITHHHADHIGGVAELKLKSKCSVYGFAHSKLNFIDHPLLEGAEVVLLGSRFQVLEVPGHTLDHIAFYAQPDDNHTHPWLFCGDTMFSGGCGRLFEGTASQMNSSLTKLSKLPENTEIFCAHEYTLSNLEFALTLMPENLDLKSYQERCKIKRAKGQSTIPSTLEIELKINPFLRTQDKELVNSMKAVVPDIGQTQTDIFAAVRSIKDNF